MNKLEQLEWKAEKAALGRAMTGVLSNGTVLKVLDIEPIHPGAVGYTSRNKTIHIAYEHEIMNGLDKPRKRAFRKGVCTHELMHQILTDFVILERNLTGLPSYEQRILAQLHNIIEDARIEHFADRYVGGTLLSSLEFAIAHTYDLAEPVENSPNALTQFLNALIMMGDLGIVKGRFSFPDAAKAFRDSAEYFSAAIYETSSRKVMKLTKEIFEIARPLWQDNADMAKLMEELAEEMNKKGKTPSSGGKPSSTPDDDEEGSESGSTIRKVSRKEFEEAMKNGGKKGGKGGKSEILKCEETKTAEEAAEAAADAAEHAKEARESAKEAKSSAKEAAKDKSSPARISNSEKAAERAESAAERAENAANAAKAAADASKAAKEAGDKEGEEANAKEAARQSLRAANAAKNAASAADAAAGNSGSSSSEDADGAAESAAQAAAAADAAKEAAEAASSGDGSGEGEGEGASGSKSKAEKAKEAAEKAAEAAKEAAEAAKAAAEAAKEGDAEGEAANARAAARAAARAKAAARAAERAAGKAEKGEAGDAEDAETMDYGDGYDSDNTSSDYSERCLNGARPDYSNASVGESEEEDGEATEFDMEDYDISDEDLDAIEREVESCVKDIEREEMIGESDSSPLPDFDIGVSRIKGAKSCLNVRVKTGDDIVRLNDNYARIVSKLKPGIDSLTSQLKRIFQDDVEEKDYRYSGKINVKRLNSGRKTARVFDRRRLPAEKSDVVVELLVDESGSMSGSRAEHAKQTAIALAEVMYNLKIPVYIIGFTADTSGYDAVHNHYITWKNTKADRLKLLNITARCNNFDGYSVRYGGEILKKKNAKHKLMIVISDGCPACYAYRGADGIPDTKDAIRDVRKDASVLGVAIGNNDTEELHYMYGKDFIHVRKMDDLFAGISKKISDIIKSWE